MSIVAYPFLYMLKVFIIFRTSFSELYYNNARINLNSNKHETLVIICFAGGVVPFQHK